MIYVCMCNDMCELYALHYLKSSIYIHVRTYLYVHNIHKCEHYFLIFRLFLFLLTCRNHLSLQNRVVSLSGWGDVQQARCCLPYGCWAVRLLRGIGCSGAPARSPACSQERGSWRRSGLNTAQGPSCLGVSINVLAFFICDPFPVYL